MISDSCSSRVAVCSSAVNAMHSRQFTLITTIERTSYINSAYTQSAPSVGTAISFEGNIRDKTRLDGAANVWQAHHHIQAGRANVLPLNE